MSSTPTPGPWKITGKTGDGKRIFVESDMERDSWECLQCEVDSDDCDSDMAMANARLIAAATDLLAACKAALQELGTIDHACSLGMMETNPAVKQLRAALAKAEGGAE